jgi:hypothetical protein
VKLKNLKELSVIEVAKFAIDNCLIKEPTFRWLVPNVFW